MLHLHVIWLAVFELLLCGSEANAVLMLPADDYPPDFPRVCPPKIGAGCPTIE